MFTLLLIVFLSLLSLTIANPDSSSALTTTKITTTTTTQDPGASKISTYFSSLTAQPAYASIVEVVATAMPDSVIESMQDGAAGPFAIGTGTQNVMTTQGWYTALPSDVKVYLSSVLQEQRHLVDSVKGSGAVGSSRRMGSGVLVLVVLMGVLGGVLVWL